MCTLIIIPCSLTKVEGGNFAPAFDRFEASLGETRLQIIDHFNIILNDQLLPAYRRYGAFQVGRNGGLLYTNMNWLLAEQLVDAQKLKILIVSALFGLIEYNLPIANYNLLISQTSGVWSNDLILRTALNEYLGSHPQIREVRSFLSDEYFNVLNGPNVNNQMIPYDRGAQRARHYINPLLQQIAAAQN